MRGRRVDARSSRVVSRSRFDANLFRARRNSLRTLRQISTQRKVARSGVYRRTDSHLSLNLVDEEKRDRFAQSHSQGPLARFRRTRSSFKLRFSGSGLARKPYALPYTQTCGTLASPRGHGSRHSSLARSFDSQ